MTPGRWFCNECKAQVLGAEGRGQACPYHPNEILVDFDDYGLAQQDKLLGRRLGGRYAIYHHLGTGGFGVTYQALDERLKRQVAVKVLKPGDGRDPQVKLRFEREAQLLARIEHPAVVSVHDMGQDETIHYLVMAWIDGTHLTAWLEAHRPGLRDRIRLVLEVLEGLAAAHAARIVHRDIKPANIMVTRTEPARGRLIDFGIAKDPNQSDLTRTGAGIGTVRYMAPETSAVPDPAYDVFAMGVLLSDLVGSQRIFAETNVVSQQMAKRAGPPDLDPGIPAPVATVIRKCLAPAAKDRYPSAGALATALHQALLDAFDNEETSLHLRNQRTAPGAGRWWYATLGVLLGLGLGVVLGRPTIDSLFPGDAAVALDATVPARDAMPSTRDAMPPTRDAVPPTRDAMPPTRDAVVPDAVTVKDLRDVQGPDSGLPDATLVVPPPRPTLPPKVRQKVVALVQGCACQQAKSLIETHAKIPNYKRWLAWVETCKTPSVDLICHPPSTSPPSW